MRLLIVVGTIFGAVTGAYLWLAPTHIELGITPPRDPGRGDFWWESHRAVFAYEGTSGTAGVLFVYRQVGKGYPDAQGWKTPAEAIAFFDEKMRERGWEAAALTWSDEIAGETRLLPHEYLRRYHRPGYAFPARRARGLARRQRRDRRISRGADDGESVAADAHRGPARLKTETAPEGAVPNPFRRTLRQ